MKKLLICFLLCSVFLNGVQAQEPALETRDVEVLFYLIDIEQINNVSQSFVANLYMEFRWHDAGLVHDGPDSISSDLDEIWHPRLQLLNQQRLVQTFPSSGEIRPDGEVIQRQRVWGGFSQPLDLRDFPFDSQRLDFTLVEVGFGTRRVRFLPSPESGVAEALTIPDWQIEGWDFSAVELPIASESSETSAMVFSLDVKRLNGFFVLKVLLPLILIVIMSWLVFWIDLGLISSRISLSITAMLTMIAYRFAIAGNIPRLPFLTHMDYFVGTSTLLVFLSLLTGVYTARLANTDRLNKARKVDFHARWIAPLIYSAVLIETFYLGIGS